MDLGDCSSVTGADLRIARQGQGESTRDSLNDSELAPNSANGSIPSLIAWAVPKPPGNAATISDLVGKVKLVLRGLDPLAWDFRCMSEDQADRMLPPSPSLIPAWLSMWLTRRLMRRNWCLAEFPK